MLQAEAGRIRLRLPVVEAAGGCRASGLKQQAQTECALRITLIGCRPTTCFRSESARSARASTPRNQIPSGQISKDRPAGTDAQGSRPCCAAQPRPAGLGPLRPSSRTSSSAGSS